MPCGENDLIKILAEPQLTTISGRPASFNSGGEFPIIVPQSLGTVSIEYRQYGTRVDFVPIVLGNGNLRLEVRPQVSEIDASRSVVINNISVPALRTRWVDTAVEMKAGQTLALAGLLQTTRGIPEPRTAVAGRSALVRRPLPTREEEVNEVELLILVTPEFVEAADPEELPPCGPGESTTTPNDVELYFRGYMEVPKCCEDGSCPKCQHGGAGETIVPGDIQPQRGRSARGGPAGAPREASAKRPASPGNPAATKSAAKTTKPARASAGTRHGNGQPQTGADRSGRLRCAEMTSDPRVSRRARRETRPAGVLVNHDQRASPGDRRPE